VCSTFPIPGGRVQVSLSGGDYATWARDGRNLYVRERNQIMAASFTPGPAAAIGAPRMLYRRDPWSVAAVSSDGQLLVFADVAREGAPVALTVQVEAVRRTP
jgi:hypothetical protein